MDTQEEDISVTLRSSARSPCTVQPTFFHFLWHNQYSSLLLSLEQ